MNNVFEDDLIRDAREEDISEIVSVIRAAFKTVADDFGFNEENSPRFTASYDRKIRYHLLVENRPMRVYIKDGKIIGYYSLAISDDNVELNNLSVLPEYRHKGIGERLVEDCFEEVLKNGKHKVKIGIVEENTVLKKWYEGFGFEHKGTEKYDCFLFTCGYMEKTI